MKHFYNEIEPYSADWIRNLQAAGQIPEGQVDERSIADVRPEDLAGFGGVHFFAGIAGWPLALKLAGWPESKPVWTGSCPCQPFSVAGKGGGAKDKRHLWPEFFRLIGECRPPVVFGEQVASPAGRDWLSGVRLDLEGLGYAVGAADLCAAGSGEEGEGWFLRGSDLRRERAIIGAPHIRQRLYWVAYAKRVGYRSDGLESKRMWRERSAGPDDVEMVGGRDASGGDLDRRGAAGGLVDGLEPGLEGHPGNGKDRNESGRVGEKQAGSTPAAGRARASFWGRFDVLPCSDGKARRVESGTFPLAHGVPARVGKLRAYGNAIVPEIAAQFVGAYLELHRSSEQSYSRSRR